MSADASLDLGASPVSPVRASELTALRRWGRGAPRHRAHSPAVAVAALAALDGPLQGARVPGAQHLPPGPPIRMAGVQRVQCRPPPPLHPPPSPPRQRARPSSSRRRRGRRAGARGGGAAQVQDALRPAPRPGAVDRPRRVGRHVGAGGEPDQLRGGHCRLRARHRPHPTSARTAPAARPPPPLPPAGFTVDAAPPSDLGAALVGRQLLYWWPDDGWQRGTVARLCPRPVFSHVVAYTRQTSALRGTADSLLDSASYGARWVLLSPAAAVGVRGRAHPQP